MERFASPLTITLSSEYDSNMTDENFCHKYVAQASQFFTVLKMKTPAAAGVGKYYFTTRNPGRLGAEPEGDIGSGLGDVGGVVGAGAGGCGFCSGSNIMPWPFSRA
jgi:hypothetical protein